MPFIEQQDLFEQYRLDEPWDSEHNLTLLEKIPSIYRCPLAPPDQSVGVTNYLGFAYDKPKSPRSTHRQLRIARSELENHKAATA